MKLLIHFVNLILWYFVPLTIVFILSFPFDFSYHDVVKSVLFGALYTIGTFVFTLFYMGSAIDGEVGFLQFIKTDNE